MGDMLQLSKIFKDQNIARTILIAFAFLLVFGEAVSWLIYPSSYSPLIVGGVTIVIVLLIALFFKPYWLLYAVVLSVFLPSGLIPASIQSLMNRSLTVLAFAASLFTFVIQHRSLRVNPPMIWMFLFLIWSGISLYWTRSLSISTTVFQTYLLRFIVFLLLIPNLFIHPRFVTGLMRTLVIVGIILLLACLYSFIAYGYQVGTRLQIFNINENWLGILSLLAMMGNIWQTIITTGGKSNAFWKITATSFLVLSVALIAMSGSRGTMIMLLMVLALFLFWKATRVWGILGFGILFFGAILMPFLFTTTLNRFLYPTNDLMLGGREILWQGALWLIRDHPMLGVGVGSSSYEMIHYVQYIGSASGQGPIAIHNPILVIWAETGIVGLIFYLGILLSSIIIFIREWPDLRLSLPNFAIPYYALISSMFLGYIFVWIKGGGEESSYSYFLMIALLIIPSVIRKHTSDMASFKVWLHSLLRSSPSCFQDYMEEAQSEQP